MDLKLAGFSGKSEDFPAWSTKFVALMHTKGLFRTVMGNDDLPEAEPTLPENPNADQMTAYNTKMQERAVLIQQRKDNRNTVWSHLALVLNNTTLMYIKNDCVAADGYGDGTKAWRLLQEKFCSVERPTVVSLVGQLAKLRLGSEEDLDDYFVRSQELMTRLSEAGEAITDTLFNALVINGLPDSFEHFVVQESFQPAKTFTELRTRLRNYDDSRRARCGEKTGNGHIAMQAVRKKKGASGGGCFVCGQKGHLARDCRSRSDSGQSGARGSGSNEASGPTSRKQGCFKCGQQGHFARDCKQAKTGFFSCCATTSMKGDDLIVDTGCTDHVVRDKAVFSSFEKWDEGTTVENPNGTISKIEGIGSVEVDIRDCQDVTRSYTFHNVLFVPSYNVNLMSVSSAIARGSSFSFTSDSSHLVAPDGRRLPVKQRGKLFFLECKFKRNAMTLATKAKMETSSAMLWHRRLGHLNKHDLISVVDVGELGFCEVCTASKMHEVAMPKKTENRAASVGVTEDDPVETEELEPPSTEPPEQRPTEIPEQRSTRTRNPPIRYGLAYTHASVIAQEPRSYLEAVSGPEREQWLAAMALEVQSLKAMGTWTLVDRPNSRKVIPGRWVLAVKRDAMGQVERFKARYVVKGFMQVEGLDFNETFAPTCKPETKRILLALGAQDDLVLHQMDVKSAFLNSPLTETVYMEQPEGFSSGDNQVCLLQRSIYGLKQAGRDWYQTLSTFLLETGFTRSTNDFCLFTMRGMDDAMIYVLVWVDDIIIGCKLQAEVDRVRDRFTDRFKMDDRGPLAWFLKMQVKRAPGSVTVNQSRYIEDCLERFGLADCKPVGTPADISTQLTKKDCPGAGSEEVVAMQREDYRGIVGSLLYIAKQTRPDILATVTQLSRFLENPGRTHWVAAKRVLRYLKGTKDLELCYIKDPDGFNLYGSADADWAGDVDDRRSTTGYSFHVQRSGAAISWSTKKQPTAAISTSEAEYQAMAAAVQEGLYLRSLLNEMDMTCDGPTVINEDNQSCIKMCKNPVMQKRTKHIDVKYHFVRERVEDGTFALEYCPTENMEADLLTKSLSKAKVDQHRRTLMGCSLTLDKANSA